MTTSALASLPDEAMKIEDISLDEIYSDMDFNIRGEITMTDVVELARDIEKHTLLQAITIQPYVKIPGCKYRIVVGHRRYAAFQYLGRTTIPAIIKHGLTEIQASCLNFVENIMRKDLNKLQEAHGIERLLKAGLTNDEIAKMIGQGVGWVQVRVLLLKLPHLVQLEAAAGFLVDNQIRDLATIKNIDDQYKIVKAIKEARLRGDTRLPTIKDKKRDPTKLVKKSTSEVYDMIEHIINEFKDGNIATRALAWVNGEISDMDFHRDLMAYAKELGVPYNPPEHVAKLLA